MKVLYVQMTDVYSIEWLCFRRPWVTPNPQTTHNFAFFVAFHIFVVNKHRDFIFGVHVDGC